MNLRLLTATGADAPAGADGKFTVDELATAILDDRALTAEVLRAEVVARCKPIQALARACATLAAWDGRYDLASRGATLWREWLAAYPGSPYAVPFDPAHPVETPRGLAPAPRKGDDPAITALRTAIAQLERAGLDPFGPLGDAQWIDKRGKKFPVPGSGFAEGATNPTLFSTWNTTRLPRSVRSEPINDATGLAAGGYPVNFGSSFMMVVGFTADGPVGRALVTYSASSDPRSPQYADQTVRYAKKDWRTIRFERRAIEADPELRVEVVE
jgi:acyl-homoserine-lactone acylase